MGEALRKLDLAGKTVSERAGLDLPAGKVRVLWDLGFVAAGA